MLPMISLFIRYKVIISITAFSIIYLYTLDNYWKPVWDSAIYISLGKSIATGNGYCYMGLPHTKYPFILPLMLSPIIKLFGLNFLLMRLLIIIFAIGSIYFTYILFKKVTDEETAEELIGANVVVSQNDIVMTGASTDFNGNYSIALDPGEYDVIISYVVYLD